MCPDLSEGKAVEPPLQGLVVQPFNGCPAVDACNHSHLVWPQQIDKARAVRCQQNLIRVRSTSEEFDKNRQCGWVQTMFGFFNDDESARFGGPDGCRDGEEEQESVGEERQRKLAP